jgi:hypothetical protein
MASIVTIQLAQNIATGEIDRDAPFLVMAPESGRSGTYIDEPEVIAQIPPGEVAAKFEAEWIGGEWKFIRRWFDA